MMRKSAPKILAMTAALLMFSILTGCKSRNIFFSVENRSGETLHDVKVTYPGDELTMETLGNSSIIGGYVHFDGPGRLSVSYSTEDRRMHGSSGPLVTGNEKGQVNIRLEGASASFETKFEESQQ